MHHPIQDKNVGRSALKAFFAVFLFISCVAVSVTVPAATGDSGKLPALEAKDMWQEFQDNQKEAENKYLSKQITVSGVVVETGMSIYATPNVRLSDSENGSTYVVCVLPRADFAKLSGFAIGQRATLTGVYRHNNSGPLIIKECKRIE